MHKIKNILKRTLAVFLCLSFLIISIAEVPVQAETSQPLSSYLNRCYNSIRDIGTLNPRPRVIASAYLVGDDDIAEASWYRDPVTHACATEAIYAVEPDTEIQGVRYDSSLYPQENLEYLKKVMEKYSTFARTNKIYNMPQGVQYIEREGGKFQVVAADEEWVTVWDRGYQSWNVYEASVNGLATGYECQNATVDAYMETHPAGFYRIPRSKVWIDFGLKSNHPYSSEAEIPKAGNGVVTKLVNLRPTPNETDNVYTPVYALPTNTEVNVVSANLVASEAPGSTRKYYKVSFNGSDKVQNNAVHYLDYKVPGVYYIDSRFLNVTPRGTRLEGTSLGEVTNVKKGGTVYVYRSKDTCSEQIGILSLGARLETFPAESDAEWTTVYFSGQKGYVQTKYIKRARYKVKNISIPYIADIVNDELVIKWNVGENNIDYSVRIEKSKGNVLWSDEHCKENCLVLKRKLIENNKGLVIRVQATDRNGEKGKEVSRYISMPRPGTKLRTTLKLGRKKKSLLTIGRNKIAGRRGYEKLGVSLQYSTGRKFRKAVTVEKYYKKKSGSGYKPVTAIKKLKPGRTYYIRRRTKKKYSTKAGVKWLSGKWSKSVKVKTKKRR